MSFHNTRQIFMFIFMLLRFMPIHPCICLLVHLACFMQFISELQKLAFTKWKCRCNYRVNTAELLHSVHISRLTYLCFWQCGKCSFVWGVDQHVVPCCTLNVDVLSVIGCCGSLSIVIFFFTINTHKNNLVIYMFYHTIASSGFKCIHTISLGLHTV